MKWLPFIRQMTFSAALLASINASAQVMPNNYPSIWDGSNLILSVDGLTERDSARMVRIEGPSGNIFKTISLPPEALLRDYFNGTLYVSGLIRERDEKTKKTKKVTHLLWRQENGNWAIDATIDAPQPAFFNIIPLNNQKYFLSASRPFIEDEQGAYLFGIYKKNHKNQLELDKPITNAFSKPSWIKDAKGEYSSTFEIGFGNVIRSLFCRTETRIIAQIEEHGLFFVFSAEDGKLLRKAAIFPEISEESLLKGKQFGPVGLGIQPTKEGKIICATLSKDFVIYSVERFPMPTIYDLGMKPGDLDDQANLSKFVASFREVEQKRIDKWPEFFWWEFDPDTGKFDKIPTPEGFPEKTEDRYIDLNWRIRADGTLTLLDRENNIKAPPKKPRKFLGLFELK
jgi:hypothetical protein